MLNICSSVQDPNQSTIHKDSDWTSQRAKEFYWSLKRLKEKRLKKCVWRNASEESAPEDTSSEAKSSEARSSEARLSEASHQEPLHQSWQSTVYEVYNH